jgi:nucleotide-binding universal stress UspA family protein
MVVTKNIFIAVDAAERTLDALALGKVLSDATGAPVVLLSVFPYDPLEDPTAEDLSRVRHEAQGILIELGEGAGVKVAEVRVVASNRVARELHRVTEEDTTGVMVLGSTSRGPLGRLLPGTMGERLLAGDGAPLAMATRGYAERPAARLDRIGVGFDGSDESRLAIDAGLLLARSSGARLRVICVFEHLAVRSVVSGRTGAAALNLHRAELRRNFDEVLAEQREELAVQGRFLEGSARELLAAESADLDLLVTGSRGYGPRAAILLGGTTHSLMRTAECPVLVLPRGVRLEG